MRVLLNLLTTPNSALDSTPYNNYPLGLLSIVDYVNERLDGVVWKVVVGPLTCEDVAAFAPDILGVSALSAFFTRARATIGRLHVRFPSLPIILGGLHISFYPGQLPGECVAGVIGEGERPFLGLLELLAGKGGLDACDLASIPSLVYHHGGRVRRSSLSNRRLRGEEIPRIASFSCCEFKAGNPVEFHIVTSRGCPYHCRFCSSSAFWNRIVYYPVEKTVSQIQHVVDCYRPFLIHIFDDLMVLNRRRLREIHDRIRSAGLHRRVAFACWVAGHVFDDEMARLLRGMNVEWISFAMESGSPPIYRYLKGDWNTPRQTARAIRLARSYGFSVSTAVIVGSPDETTEDMQTSYDLVRSLPVTGGFVSLLKAYPGTRLWEEAKGRGIVSDEMPDWSVIELNDLTNPATRYLGRAATREDTLRYYQAFERLFVRKRKIMAFRRLVRYAARPRFLLRRLAKTRRLPRPKVS